MLTTEEWKNAFEAEGGVLLCQYFHNRGKYTSFYKHLQKENASLTTDVVRSGRCIAIDAPLSIRNIVVLIPNGNGGHSTIMLVRHYSDHNH